MCAFILLFPMINWRRFCRIGGTATTQITPSRGGRQVVCLLNCLCNVCTVPYYCFVDSLCHLVRSHVIYYQVPPPPSLVNWEKTSLQSVIIITTIIIYSQYSLSYIIDRDSSERKRQKSNFLPLICISALCQSMIGFFSSSASSISLLLKK